MHIKYKIIFFLSILYIVGFGQTIEYNKKLLMDSTYTLQPPSNLSGEDLKSDVEFLIYVLKTGYGLYDHIDSKLKQDVENELNNLKKIKTTSPDSLCIKIGQILNRFPDGHLVTMRYGQDCLSASQHGYRIPSVGTNYYYNTVEKSKCWKMQYIKRAADFIPVLSIIKFPAPKNNQWNGFIDSVKKMVQSPNIIIDLRGNQGGNDGMGYDLIASLNGKPIKSVVEYFISKQTPAACAIMANTYFIEMQNLQKKNEKIPSYVTDDYLMFINHFNQAIEKKNLENDTVYINENETKGKSFLKDKYTGKIYVLAWL